MVSLEFVFSWSQFVSVLGLTSKTGFVIISSKSSTGSLGEFESSFGGLFVWPGVSVMSVFPFPPPFSLPPLPGWVIGWNISPPPSKQSSEM